MKASTFLKIIIVLIAIVVIGYIIHNSNKAAEINNLVSAPTNSYEFAQHVDSVTNNIRPADFKEAKQLYDQLYEEIDVYSEIRKQDGELVLEVPMQDKLFENAFNAYWPKLENAANDLFGSTNWAPSQNKLFRDEVTRLVVPSSSKKKWHRGINQKRKETLKTYQDYIYGYSSFSNLLNTVENCTDASTYRRVDDLRKYANYPYNNLSKFQKRRADARETAKKHWKEHLRRQVTSMLNLQYEYITPADLASFSNQSDEWSKRAKDYDKATGETYFEDNYVGQIEYKYRTLYQQYYNHKEP